MKEFRLRQDECMEDNVRRIIDGQIRYIYRHTGNGQSDIHESIHEIRKSLKRIRAVLRLVRDSIGYSSYHRENVCFRDLGRKLSEIRNMNVMAGTLTRLGSELGDQFPDESIHTFRERLISRRDMLLYQLLREEGFFKTLDREIIAAGKRIARLPFENEGFEVIRGGLRRVYRQGRMYVYTGMKDLAPEEIHDMRKRMKYLWYQMELLLPINPGLMKEYASSLEKITESLGLYNDYQVLSTFLSEEAGTLDDSRKDTLSEACEFKKAGLLNSIRRPSRMVYSEDPETFLKRLEGYWDVSHLSPGKSNSFQHPKNENISSYGSHS